MKRLTRYLITFGITVFLAGVVFVYEMQYYDIKTQLWLIISNSAFVSGIVVLMVGLLCFVSNKGGMDALIYVIYRVKNKFRNIISENYTEFVNVRREKNGIKTDNMMILGGSAIIIAIIATLIYNMR